jgi:hypothetical protein
MTFEDILDQAIAMLQRRGRLTYSTLKRQFQLDDEALTDLKNELLYAHPEVRDDAGQGLIWRRNPDTVPAAAAAPPLRPLVRLRRRRGQRPSPSRGRVSYLSAL